jgi:hypothetical protein
MSLSLLCFIYSFTINYTIDGADNRTVIVPNQVLQYINTIINILYY